MSSDWRSDLNDSAADFYYVVWPKIKHWFGGGDLLPVESVKQSEMAAALDQLAGIDGWHIQKNEMRMRGVASRVQWEPPPPSESSWEYCFWREWTRETVYKTFTIRSKRVTGAATEFEKRITNFDKGWLYPAITTQAYLKTKRGQLIYACAVRTLDLYRAIQFYPEILHPQKNGQDGNEFFFVNVADLKTKNVEVKEF